MDKRAILNMIENYRKKCETDGALEADKMLAQVSLMVYYYLEDIKHEAS